MKVAFDASKNVKNQDKHGVSLAFGAEVLADANRLELLDVRVDYAEERFIAHGMVKGRVWVCVYTRRADVYRLISVRKANERETRRYQYSFR
jgi:hypothetical protein